MLKTIELERDLNVNKDPELKFSKLREIQVNKANKIQGFICKSYEYMDREILINLFIALVKLNLKFCIVCSPRFIKERKLIEGLQKRFPKLMNIGRESDENQFAKSVLSSNSWKYD